MKPIIAITAGALLPILFPTATLHAEETAAPMTYEERVESVANIEKHIAQRQARLQEWAKEITDLDARIEKRIAETVDTLKGFRDSPDSRRQVADLKEDAIESLGKAIEVFRMKRRQMEEIIRSGDAAALGDLDKIDRHMATMIEQISELAQSMPTYENIPKYEGGGGGGYWGGAYVEYERVSENWRQMRRDTNASDQQRDQLLAAIDKAIERVEARRRLLELQISSPGASQAEIDLCTLELGQADGHLAHLRKTRKEIATATNEGTGKQIGADQAHDLRRLFDDLREDVRADMTRLFGLYDRYVQGRAYIAGLQGNLDARKEWLAKNPPPAP